MLCWSSRVGGGQWGAGCHRMCYVYRSLINIWASRSAAFTAVMLCRATNLVWARWNTLLIVVALWTVDDEVVPHLRFDCRRSLQGVVSVKQLFLSAVEVHLSQFEHPMQTQTTRPQMMYGEQGVCC